MLIKNNKISKKMFIDTLILLVIVELAGSLTSLIDGTITGRFLGNEAMGAFNYSGTYFSLFSILIGILTIGNQSICVKAISKGHKEDVNKTISLAFIVGACLTIIISILMFSFSKGTGILFGISKDSLDTLSNFSSYLKGVCLGSPFWCLYVLLTPIVQLDGHGKRAKLAVIMVGISDVILDFLFGIVLKMGLFGIGLATSISYLVGFLIIISFFFSKKATYHFEFKNVSLNNTFNLFKEGTSKAVAAVSRMIGPILLNLIIVNISEDSSNAVVALSIQRNVSLVFASLGFGVNGTILMLETLFFNEKNFSEIKAIIHYSLFTILIVINCFSILLLGLSPFIARIYLADWNTNIELYNLTKLALKYYILSLVFSALNISFSTYLHSVGKNLLPIILNAFVECFSLVLGCLICSKINSYEGFFQGYLFGQMGLTIILMLYVVINCLINWKEKYGVFFISKGYFNEKDKILQASLSTYDEVETFSIEAHQLCLDLNIDKKTAYKVGLCVEELACNVFEHGFTKDSKKHVVEMNVVVSESQVVITIIDDCKKFDISKKLKCWDLNQEHPEKNIGIRTIMALSKEVTYSNTLNMNHLQIII